MGINRKVFYVNCIKRCEYGGVRHEVGNIKKFYSALKAKHFVKNAPEGCFESGGSSEEKQKPKKAKNDDKSQ